MGFDGFGDEFSKMDLEGFSKDAHGDEEPEEVEVEVEGMDEGYVGVGGLGDGYVPFDACRGDSQYLFDVLVEEVPKEHHRAGDVPAFTDSPR